MGNTGKTYTNISGNRLPRFVEVLLKLTLETETLRKAPAKDMTVGHVEYCLSNMYGFNWLDSRSLQMKLHYVESFSVNQWETSLPIIETKTQNPC